MKISFVQLTDSCRIVGKNGYLENSWFNNKAHDIELVNHSHFEIRHKGDPEILAIIPFGRAKFAYPETSDDFVDLDEVEYEEPQTLEIVGEPPKKRGRPKLSK